MRFKDLKTGDKCILIGIGLLPVFILIGLFFKHHVPMKAYYDKEAQELVISPGFLYTLEGYEIEHIYPYPEEEEILLPLFESSEPEYRFSGVYGDHFVGEEILIYYRNSLTGELRFDEICVQRMTFGDFRGNWFYVNTIHSSCGSGINIDFSLYPEE